jgi:hypothetical protein
VRDRHLLTDPVGRALIARYYAFSPALAEQVRQTPWLASLVRGLLSPVLSAARWLLA